MDTGPAQLRVVIDLHGTQPLVMEVDAATVLARPNKIFSLVYEYHRRLCTHDNCPEYPAPLARQVWTAHKHMDYPGTPGVIDLLWDVHEDFWHDTFAAAVQLLVAPEKRDWPYHIRTVMYRSDTPEQIQGYSLSVDGESSRLVSHVRPSGARHTIKGGDVFRLNKPGAHTILCPREPFLSLPRASCFESHSSAVCARFSSHAQLYTSSGEEAESLRARVSDPGPTHPVNDVRYDFMDIRWVHTSLHRSERVLAEYLWATSMRAFARFLPTVANRLFLSPTERLEDIITKTITVATQNNLALRIYVLHVQQAYEHLLLSTTCVGLEPQPVLVPLLQSLTGCVLDPLADSLSSPGLHSVVLTGYNLAPVLATSRLGSQIAYLGALPAYASLHGYTDSEIARLSSPTRPRIDQLDTVRYYAPLGDAAPIYDYEQATLEINGSRSNVSRAPISWRLGALAARVLRKSTTQCNELLHVLGELCGGGQAECPAGSSFASHPEEFVAHLLGGGMDRTEFCDGLLRLGLVQLCPTDSTTQLVRYKAAGRKAQDVLKILHERLKKLAPNVETVTICGRTFRVDSVPPEALALLTIQLLERRYHGVPFWALPKRERVVHNDLTDIYRLLYCAMLAQNEFQVFRIGLSNGFMDIFLFNKKLRAITIVELKSIDWRDMLPVMFPHQFPGRIPGATVSEDELKRVYRAERFRERLTKSPRGRVDCTPCDLPNDTPDVPNDTPDVPNDTPDVEPFAWPDLMHEYKDEDTGKRCLETANERLDRGVGQLGEYVDGFLALKTADKRMIWFEDGEITHIFPMVVMLIGGSMCVVKTTERREVTGYPVFVGVSDVQPDSEKTLRKITEYSPDGQVQYTMPCD